MSRTMYLVVRRALDGDGTACSDQSGIDTGSRVPLRLFALRAAADAFTAERSAEARRTMNPFHLLDAETHEPVRQRLLSLNLPVDCPGADEWIDVWKAWWDRCQDQITDDQRAAVWAALGDTPPFEVLEIEMDE